MTAAKDRVRLWLRLLKVVRGIEHELRDKLRREHNTTLPRFDVMSALSRHPEGLKMSKLSGVLRVSNGNVTGIADRLSEEGLVERVAVPVLTPAWCADALLDLASGSSPVRVLVNQESGETFNEENETA